MFKTYFTLLSICILFQGCTKPVTIDGFDAAGWKADYMGCMNNRIPLSKILLSKKDELKKLDDDAITKLLGNPERNRQFSRGIKYYIYFIEGGNQCQSSTNKAEGKKLILEFDALGMPRIIRESYIDF